MRRAHLEYLVCPISGRLLKLTAFKVNGGHVSDGLLEAPGGHWYPVIGGVPRMLTGSLREHLLRRHRTFLYRFGPRLPKPVRDEWRHLGLTPENAEGSDAHQLQTSDSFAFEWQNIYQDNAFEKNNFLHFVSPYLKERDFSDKIVVDAGCGSGRFTKQAALMDAQIVIGTDISESVVTAYERTKELPNIMIVQADIYNMPLLEVADYTMSIGVLHHLPNPEQGFASLRKTLKRGGSIIIWVYARRNNSRAIYIYEPLRLVTKRLPKRFLYGLCYIPAAVVHGINLVGVSLRWAGCESLAKKMPFSYYANFPFNMKLNDAFDVLATPKSNYYYPETVVAWYKRCGFKHVRYNEHPEAGITLIGRKQ